MSSLISILSVSPTASRGGTTSFTGSISTQGAEIVCLRAVARGQVKAPDIEAADPGPADPSAAQRGTHRVWTPGGSTDVATYERAELCAGMMIAGYAIVEQYDATTVILPGYSATVDSWQNLIIRPAEARL